MVKRRPSRPNIAAARVPDSGGGVPKALLGAAVSAVAAASMCAVLLGGHFGGSRSNPSAVTVRAVHNGAALGVGEPGDPPSQPFDHKLTAGDFDAAGEQPYAVFAAVDGRRLQCAPKHLARALVVADTACFVRTRTSCCCIGALTLLRTV